MKKLSWRNALLGILLPTATLAYYYSNNLSEIQLTFILLLVGSAALLGILVFLVSSVLFHDCGIPASMMVFWVAFFLSGKVRALTASMSNRSVRLLLLLFLILSAAVYFCDWNPLRKNPSERGYDHSLPDDGRAPDCQLHPDRLVFHDKIED